MWKDPGLATGWVALDKSLNMFESVLDLWNGHYTPDLGLGAE